MAKTGRNEPCPSGAGIKFKKCLLEHPELRQQATPADTWWACCRWTAPVPAPADLLVALVSAKKVATEKLRAFIEAALREPPETVVWISVWLNFARHDYPDLPNLFRRIAAAVPDTPLTQMAFFHAAAAQHFEKSQPEMLPEVAAACRALNPQTADAKPIRDILRCLKRAGLPAEADQLQQRFAEILTGPEPADAEADAESGTEPPRGPTGLDPGAEPDWPPEIAARLDRLWDDYKTLRPPTAAQMDEFLTQLLALPPEATSWSELVHEFARQRHPDLPGVFRRIASAIPHTKGTAMSYFYWAAAEEFTRHGSSALLPEVATGFRRLDRASYDADGLKHLEDCLLAYGFETEVLELAEHFLAIQRDDDDGLMPYVVPERCGMVFDLRLGRLLRAGPTASRTADALAAELCRGLEEDVAPEVGRLGAEIACGQAPEPSWTRAHFELVPADTGSEEAAFRENLRLFASLIGVAREAWQVEQATPGCVLRGLNLVQSAAHDWRNWRHEKKKQAPTNLMDYLSPERLEERIARRCRDLIGVNKPLARLALAGHGWLARFAQRRGLITTAQAMQTETKLSRLREKLDAPA